MGSVRQQRVGDVILGFLGQELRMLGDDRLNFLTLTSIEVSPDLKYATAFWTMPVRGHKLTASQSSEQSAPGTNADAIDFPTAEEIQAIDAILAEHKKALRKRVGEELSLRYTPDIRFKYDYSEEQGYKIDKLLGKI